MFDGGIPEKALDFNDIIVAKKTKVPVDFCFYDNATSSIDPDEAYFRANAQDQCQEKLTAIVEKPEALLNDSDLLTIPKRNREWQFDFWQSSPDAETRPFALNNEMVPERRKSVAFDGSLDLGIPAPELLFGKKQIQNINAINNNKLKVELNIIERHLVESGKSINIDDRIYAFQRGYWMELHKRNQNRIIRAVLEEGGLQGVLADSDYTNIRKLLFSNEALVTPRFSQDNMFLLNLKDGVLDARTMICRPHDPQYGFFHLIDVGCREVMKPPNAGECFTAFLEQVSGGDETVIRQVYEWIYLILFRVPIKKFIALVGPPGTGKTQLCRFLQELVGHENTHTIRDIRDLSERFTMGPFEGKAFIGCFDLPDRILPKRAVGLIKQLVGDDSIAVELKGLTPCTIYNKPLFVCAGNYGIKLPSEDAALLKRICIIPFCHPVSEGEQMPELYKNFFHERAYIIKQAIRVGNELQDRNLAITESFVPNEYQVQVGATEHQDDIIRFVRVACVADPEASVTTSDLFRCYTGIAVQQNLRPLSIEAFSRELKNALCQLYSETVLYDKNAAGKDKRGYRGLSLRKNN